MYPVASSTTDASSSSVTTSIRLAERQDAAALARIINLAYRTTRSWTHEVHLVKGDRLSEAGVEAIILAGEDQLFVCQDEDREAGRIVGCICAEWGLNHRDTGLGQDAVMLGLFAVDPDVQSQGIGTKLMRHAMAHAHERWHCTTAVMWVIRQREDILKWYRRLGFQETGETKDFVFPELQLRDDIAFLVLAKKLP
jgi:ribosomal protein S18 acetylase RimI-like enzyme